MHSWLEKVRLTKCAAEQALALVSTITVTADGPWRAKATQSSVSVEERRRRRVRPPESAGALRKFNHELVPSCAKSTLELTSERIAYLKSSNKRAAGGPKIQIIQRNQSAIHSFMRLECTTNSH